MALALVWKPPGEGSQQFLGRLKREWKVGGKSREGIGHTGTLDPFAEGLLCVGTDEGTKLLHPLTGLSKSYRARFVFGVTSDTLDVTGALSPQKLANPDALATFFETSAQNFLDSKLGRFEQVPPQFSAVHVDGKRAYDWAREGVTKELKSRTAELLGARSRGWQRLTSAELLSTSLGVARGAEAFQVFPRATKPELAPVALEKGPLYAWDVELSVSSGTYIRSLARDWGLELAGAPGLLSSLVRTRIGPFELPEGQTQSWLGLGQIEKLFDIERLSAEAADALQRYGRWNPQACTKTRLLVDDAGTPVAWVEAPSGKIGRVFRADPLQSH